MGILTYIKISVLVAAFLAGSFVAHKYYAPKLAARDAEIAEQHKIIVWHERAGKVDEGTKEVHNEIQKARDAGDIPMLVEQYRRLLRHQRHISGKGVESSNHDAD